MSNAIQPAGKNTAKRDFVCVRASGIQGKGLFAKRKIPKGTRIIEYEGDRIPMKSIVRRSAEQLSGGVYVFHLNATTVIDGASNGNDARFANHSCDPNCEAYAFDDRVYLYAMRDIVRGEELTFDYKLASPGAARARKSDRLFYACHCGSSACRGTMLAGRKRGRLSTVHPH